jgi:hypothetical protein
LIEANGREAALLRRGGAISALLATTAAGNDRVSEIMWVIAPSKLAAIIRDA